MKNIFYFFTLVTVLINISNAQQVIDTIEVSTGWNIIGALSNGEINGLSSGVTLDLIITDPPGIITSPFYGFNPGASYYQADSLKRGNGYWVKVSQNGKIIYVSYTDCGTVDYAGKIYNTVLIGGQCWLKENLDVGTMIDSTLDATNNGVIEKYCYNDDPANCNIYGGLYMWNEAMQYSTTPGVQGICPPGWHIPTNGEFQTLSTTVGGDGNALKAIGQGTGGGEGTNTSGFSALLAGYRWINSIRFRELGYTTHFWSSTESNSTNGVDRDLSRSVSTFGQNSNNKVAGLSVRCLKD